MPRPERASFPCLAALALVASACSSQSSSTPTTAPPTAPRQAADLILVDGVVWTVDDERPRAQAVAVIDGRIAAVGTNEEVGALLGDGTRVLSLDGAFVLPGFVDNHVHFASAARFLEFNVMNVTSQEEFASRVREVVAKVPAGEWILGGYWGAYDSWSAASAGGRSREPFTPDMALVEQLTREHPMFIRRFDNSEFAVNQAALGAAGLTY